MLQHQNLRLIKGGNLLHHFVLEDVSILHSRRSSKRLTVSDSIKVRTSWFPGPPRLPFLAAPFDPQDLPMVLLARPWLQRPTESFQGVGYLS